MRGRILHIALVFILARSIAEAQISPGDLATAHVELEGIMNCTECHILGGGVSNEKCLDCHQELKIRINQNKGYHSSSEVSNNDCASCHSDHHGREFEMIRINEEDFNHQLTGYELTGQHQRIDCRQCHTPDLIVDSGLKKNKSTFLGLETDCISCHEDIHQKTLSQDCASCHTTEAFSPPANFNHNNADFALVGQHRNVACIECHRMETRNGKDFQRFTNIPFENCTSCHQDVHDNKFGQNCTECHSEQSFRVAGYSKNFDHNMTGFRLTGRHRFVDCKQCHKVNFTNPLPHNRCASCHTDYHKREFAVNRVSPDCSECHTINNFRGSSYTIEKHNEGNFQLEGAHLATPCFACHKQTTRWSFRNIGERCVDCHKDVHVGYINEKYYPNQSCEACHDVTRWEANRFDHSLTNFELAGAHARQECMACHSVDDLNHSNRYENFQNLSMECVGCHDDVHRQQFAEDGITYCLECHSYENWGSVHFNHDKTAFKLDGEHVKVDCGSCHKEVEESGETFVFYKVKNFECIDCHQ